MKTNTLMERLTRVSVRDAVPVFLPGNILVAYTFSPPREVKVRLVMNAFGTPVVYSDEHFKIPSYLAHFKDLADVEVLPDKVFYVNRQEAVLNAFGFSNGFAYKLGEININFEDDDLRTDIAGL